jgi:4-hydroxy-tetrahydrodipicolinate synthase
MQWKGVISAITTPFKPDLAVDHAFLAEHAAWQLENGVDGIVALGSLGEAATLSFDEKVAILRTLAGVMHGKPLVAGIASLSTSEAIALAKAAQDVGCSGLMVLPPYVYSTDWREMKAHVAAVIGATKLTCMLYNNPPAYKTDFLAPQIAELAAEHKNLQAVKESSGDARRVTAVKALCGDRIAVFAGLDDMILEAIAVGATGWIAGHSDEGSQSQSETFLRIGPGVPRRE